MELAAGARLKHRATGRDGQTASQRLGCEVPPFSAEWALGREQQGEFIHPAWRAIGPMREGAKRREGIGL